MAKSGKIQSLDSLDKEIYRLKLHARDLEGQLDKNIEHLQQNYGGMIRNSIFGKKTGASAMSGGLFFTEKVQEGINKIVDHLAEKAVEGVDAVIDKVFKKKES